MEARCTFRMNQMFEYSSLLNRSTSHTLNLELVFYFGPVVASLSDSLPRFIPSKSTPVSPSSSGPLFSFHLIMPRVLRIYIIRHGETAENAAGMVQGQLNTQLNQVGIDQATILAQALRPRESDEQHDGSFVYEDGKCVRFDYAFTSDLDRARDVNLVFYLRASKGRELILYNLDCQINYEVSTSSYIY